MQLRHIYWRLQSKFNKMCGSCLRWLPVQSGKIVFNNFQGKGYGDSPKYIAEEMLRRGQSFDLVWLVNDLSVEMPPGIRKVSLLSVRACYELSTAAVVISNVKVALPYHKKRSQLYVQTWHGSVAFKAIEADAVDKLRPQYVKESQADSKAINLFLSCNSIQTQEIKTIFWYDGEIFESGSPRNDILFQSADCQQRIKQRLGIAADTKVLLYAPTFRDDFRTDVYRLNLERIRLTLEQRWGGRWHVLVRLHPNVMVADLFHTSKEVTDVASYPDMQELLLIADAMITDYSSTIYDVAIMHKVVLLYAPDLDDYRENRGLKPVYFKFPSRICQHEDELLDAISTFSHAQYQQRLDAFLADIRIFDDGKAAGRVVDRILSEIKKQ